MVEDSDNDDDVFERFNEQPFKWEPYLKEWEELWRKANPGYPIHIRKSNG